MTISVSRERVYATALRVFGMEIKFCTPTFYVHRVGSWKQRMMLLAFDVAED